METQQAPYNVVSDLQLEDKCTSLLLLEGKKKSSEVKMVTFCHDSMMQLIRNVMLINNPIQGKRY